MKNSYQLDQKDFKVLWSNLKASAKKRNIEFNLSPSDLDEIGIPLTCPILGIPLKFHKGKQQDDSISFDRIDSEKGYSIDNIVVVSYRVNKLKSDASYTEMEKIFNFYQSIQ